MSFISHVEGAGYAPGYFLAHADCVRETRQMEQANATTADNGAKYIPAGTVYPSNDANAEGIVYEDVDVTSGDMPGSVVVSGTVYADLLPETLADEAKTALTGKGFVFVDTAPTMTRPY